ncbi:MAG: hypothetical protein JWO38_1849 [Gemmataceae bacterium]|nr:hypothetical protein [Gemmataceae bacterium]
MVRKLTRFSLVAALGAAVATQSVGPGLSADDKKSDEVPAIKEIMSTGHKGDDALYAKITKSYKDGKWEDAQKAAKTLADNGAALGKNTPKRGEVKSWEALAKKYADNTKAVADATEKKDANATKTALGAIGASCKACHTAHKGK